MKTHTSITVDVEKLKLLRDEGIIFSAWVNEKLAEYAIHKGNLQTLKTEKSFPLTSQEALLLYDNLKALEDAKQKENEQKEQEALERQKRIIFIRERLDQLTIDKMKETHSLGIELIKREQKELHDELNNLQKKK